MKIQMISIVVLLLALASCTQVVEKDYNLNKISVVGDAKIDVSPDEVELLFSVNSEGKSLVDVQKDNAKLTAQIIDALKANGVKVKELETVNYFVDQIKEWDNNKYVFKGYRVRNSIKLTTKNLDRVGSFIDVAVGNGANDVDGVSFRLSDELKMKVKEQLLQKASLTAKSKADVLAKTLGVSVGKPLYISEGNVDVAPVYYSRDYLKASSSMESAPQTPIMPKEVSTSALVSVVFEIR